MWSQLALCLLVGLAYASNSNNPGWKDNTEYVYEIRGRTLSSLHEVADEYSGILLKAQLLVRPRTDGNLVAKISNAQYGQIHSQLSEGWNTLIPDSQLSYKKLSTTDKPFEIVMKKGVVRDIIVDQQVPEWEANIIRSIVSQFQLDTKAANAIDSQVNTLPEDDSNTAVFKTLEDTVTGITETLYEIHPLPEYVLQSKPWLAPFPHLKGDGEVIEIVKNKNFSRSEERPGYHFGLHGMGQWESATNQLGQILTRTSLGHAVITGTLNRFTIQHTMTVNKIFVSPTLNNKQKGSVISMLNLTLSNAQPQNVQFEKLTNPISLGSLVYRFNKVNSESIKVRPGKQFNPEEYRDVSGSNSDESMEKRLNSPSMGRFRRSLEQQIRNNENRRDSSSHSDSSISSEEYWQQEQPKLNEAPESPFLPLTMGYEGKSVKYAENVDIVQAAQKLAQQVGQDLQTVEEIPKKETLSKFVLLATITRTMNEKELQQVSQDLYNKEEGPKRYSWIAFRDAVAECGTGPALLTIREWIETRKITHEEAAEVIETMSQAVRQPTEEYIRTFYAMITKPEVMEQSTLNETALLSFSDLVYRVYVNKRESHMEYPVHSFGKFRTESGKAFLKNEFISFLTKQLKEAISKADNRKIHVYIRCLGNVGHQQILSVFEPYLEGKKQVSQFQRLLMVVSMDKLLKAQPKLARSVLYKIYQNAGEAQEIRIAAVYQLMRTSPPTDMLQRMAEYTNLDINDHVNAAVKSAIETAAQLNGNEFEYLRSSAEAAMPLLTKKVFGIQYPRDHLRSYVVKEMKLTYKQTIQSLVNEDSVLPSALKYSLRAKIGGLRRQFITVEGMVSSIDELVHVWRQQTETYKQERENQQHSEKSNWSSENIARFLNLQIEEREQLEGNMYLRIGDLHRLWSFDNRTIEFMPEIIRQLEETLKQGKTFKYTKFINNGEFAIAFPTEMGLPFMYTYDMPTLLKIEGKISADAQPQLSNNNKLNRPETIKAQTEVRATVSARAQTKIGFVTPFDHQEYSAGYDKNVQINLPIRSKIFIDLKNRKVEAELEALEPEKNSRLFHYSSWPYTATHDILTLQPIAGRPSTQIIHKKVQHSMDHVFGQKSTGLAFRVKYHTEEKFIDLTYWMEKLQHHDALSALMAPWLQETIQHTEVDVDYAGELSSNRKLKIHMNSEHKYQTKYEDENNDSTKTLDVKDLAKLPKESVARKQEILRKALTGIRNAQAHAYETVIEFQGQQNVKFVATAALGKSDVDPKSRILFFLKKETSMPEDKHFVVAFTAKSHFPNTNALDLTYAMKFDRTSTSQVQLAFGENMESATKMTANIKLHKSRDYNQYLIEQPMYHQCKREMEQGNYILPACVNMTAMANLMDRVKIQVQYENLPHHQFYNGLRYFNYFTVNEHTKYEGHGKENQIDMEARFYPDFEAVNVTLATKDMERQLNNIRVGEWTRRVVAVHPVFHVRSRLSGKLLGLHSFRPICVVDKSAANTFDNKTYPMKLSNVWTVMLQYVPLRARQHHEQQRSAEKILKHQLENYAVLLRQSNEGADRKDVKIIVSTPETEGQVVEITLKSSESKASPKVFVNEKEIQVSEQHIYEIRQGAVQIYLLPNGEVKVEVRNGFYVIFDGVRVKLTVLDNKFRSSIVGLCGTFTGEKATDFWTPNNCIVRDPREFIASYAILEQGSQNQEIMDLKTRSQKSHCIYKKVPLYANVISERDAGREQGNQERHSKGCSKHQTRYVEENGEICFTLRPVPVCRSECQQRGSINKNVDVHCVQKSNVADLWRNQIDKGASPDFSLKTATKTIRMELPQRCSK